MCGGLRREPWEDREEGRVVAAADAEQPEERQGLPVTPQVGGEAWDRYGLFSRAFESTWPRDTLLSDSQHPEPAESSSFVLSHP